MLEKITVELNLTGLDESFKDMEDFKARAKELTLSYYNIGEGTEWSEGVAFTVVEQK